MNNYINVRVQAHNHTKTYNSIKHNLRVVKSLNQNIDSKNSNYILLDNKIIEINNKNKKEIYNQLSTNYQNERLEHNEIYKKHNKRNLRDVKSTWCEGVFTFSEQMKEDLKNKKYDLNDLMKVANECLKEIAATYDTKVNYMTLHLDETTPHFHFSFSNFDDRGMSLFHSNKNSLFLSQLQDIGFKHFTSLGMERGKSKEITCVNNKSINKFWRDKNIQQKQQNIILNNQNKDLFKTKENLTNVISNNQNLISGLDTQLNDLQLKKIDLDIDLENSKKLRDDVKNDTNKSIEEKKKNYDEITKQQKQIRTLRQVYTNKEKSIKELKNEILNDIKEILEKSKKIIGYDEQKLQQNIFQKLNKYSKYKLRVKELETNQNDMKKLKDDNIKLVEKIGKLETKLDNMHEIDKESSKLIKEYQTKEKADNRFSNSEVANVTMKYENELKSLKKENKILIQDKENLNSKINDYEDFIIDNDLKEDFNNRNNKKQNRNR